MEKRFILALTLSILVIIFFQFLIQPPEKQSQVPAPTSYSSSASIQKTGESLQKSLPLQKQPLEEEIIEKVTSIETERFILKFTNIGGALREVILKDYRDEKGLPMVLVQAPSYDKSIFSLVTPGDLGLFQKRFKLEKKDRNLVSYSYTEPDKFKIVKEFRLHKSRYFIDLRIYWINLSKEKMLKEYKMLAAGSLAQMPVAMGRRFLQAIYMVDGRVTRYSRLKQSSVIIEGFVSWIGLTERYFCLVLKPETASGIIIDRSEKNSFITWVKSKREIVFPDTEVVDEYILYVGPNDISRLKLLDLQDVVSYGMFSGITKMLLFILRSSYKVTHNWGLSIILLTCIINFVLFPLTRKSFLSMKKMQEIQPHIEKLRKLHKDNPQRLNKEMMELYRKYNVNPFGGCLPMLLQLPIFIALYQGLIRSIELKGATFLWIKDLSLPDVVKLPFTLPLFGDNLHILPLFMVIAMFIQQWLSLKTSHIQTPEQIQQQRFMMIFFPIFFGVLFYNFPSGLVLYWLSNTLLMMAEHSALRKLHR